MQSSEKPKFDAVVSIAAIGNKRRTVRSQIELDDFVLVIVMITLGKSLGLGSFNQARFCQRRDFFPGRDEEKEHARFRDDHGADEDSDQQLPATLLLFGTGTLFGLFIGGCVRSGCSAG